MRLCLIALPIMFIGCSHVGGGRGDNIPERVHLASEQVTYYGKIQPVALEGVEGRILSLLARVAQRKGGPAPRADRAAQQTALEIGRALPSKGPPPSEVVEFAMWSHGIVDPPPHMVIANLPPGLEASVLDQLGERFARILGRRPFSRVGIGIVRSRSTPARVLVALLENRVHLRPFPRRLGRGAEKLSFTVRSTHRNVRLIVTSPDGKTSPLPLARAGARYVAPLRCRRKGAYKVEVTGEGPLGPEVLANFPVYCQQDPPRQVRYRLVPRLVAGEEEMEQLMLSETNRIREREGLPSLRGSRALRVVARAHSKDMMSAGYVGHVSPTTGRPTDRLRDAKVVHLVVRENVAQAYSPRGAIRELMNSPAHRKNILSRDVTEIGIGVAVDRRGPTPVLLVTQLFIRPGKAYDPATAVGDVLGVLLRARRSAGLRPLREEPGLTRLARAHVRKLIEGAGGKAEPTLAAALKRLGPRFRQVDGIQIQVSAIESLERADEILRQRYTHVGVGVGQSKGQVIIFLLLAGN